MHFCMVISMKLIYAVLCCVKYTGDDLIVYIFCIAVLVLHNKGQFVTVISRVPKQILETLSLPLEAIIYSCSIKLIRENTA